MAALVWLVLLYAGGLRSLVLDWDGAVARLSGKVPADFAPGVVAEVLGGAFDYDGGAFRAALREALLGRVVAIAHAAAVLGVVLPAPGTVAVDFVAEFLELQRLLDGIGMCGRKGDDAGGAQEILRKQETGMENVTGYLLSHEEKFPKQQRLFGRFDSESRLQAAVRTLLERKRPAARGGDSGENHGP